MNTRSHEISHKHASICNKCFSCFSDCKRHEEKHAKDSKQHDQRPQLEPGTRDAFSLREESSSEVERFNC